MHVHVRANVYIHTHGHTTQRRKRIKSKNMNKRTPLYRVFLLSSVLAKLPFFLGALRYSLLVHSETQLVVTSWRMVSVGTFKPYGESFLPLYNVSDSAQLSLPVHRGCFHLLISLLPSFAIQSNWGGTHHNATILGFLLISMAPSDHSQERAQLVRFEY